MKIAIGIAQGLRYMHEQCPRGPIVHGDLRACNVLLGHNLEPQVNSVTFFVFILNEICLI